ncbi:MAG: hypothetical protein AAGK14_14750 [Verrucomicrobiota bacterium]
MTDRLKGNRAYGFGVSADDVAQLEVTDDLVADILTCLDSDDFAAIQMALLFAETLLGANRLDEKQVGALLRRVQNLVGSKHARVHGPALKLLSMCRVHVPNYREMMLAALEDDDPMARRQALVVYPTYCHPKEVQPLERFEHDEHKVETSMGGPLLYDLRNLALEKIEEVLGKQFKKTEETQPYRVERSFIGGAGSHTTTGKKTGSSVCSVEQTRTLIPLAAVAAKG